MQTHQHTEKECADNTRSVKSINNFFTKKSKWDETLVVLA